MSPTRTRSELGIRVSGRFLRDSVFHRIRPHCPRHLPPGMAGDSPDASGPVAVPPPGRSRDLLAVEHNDASDVPPSLLVDSSKKGPTEKGAPTKPSFAPPPPSALLCRLRSFLPQMAAANDNLETQMREGNAEDFDVENVGEDDDERRIEMDVGVGVLDLKTDEAAEMVAGKAGVAVVDQDDDTEEDARRRKKIKEAREDSSIKIPGLDPEEGGRAAGIEEL